MGALASIDETVEVRDPEEADESVTVADPVPRRPPTGVTQRTIEAVDALSKSDTQRSRMVAILGAGLGLIAMLVSTLITGDPTARAIMMVGLFVVAACNTWVFATARESTSLTPKGAPVVVWNLCAVGALAILPFTGPLSAGVAAPFLVVTLVNQGQSRAAALSTLVTTIVGQATLAALVFARVVPDVGLAPFPDVTLLELVIAESLFIGVLVLGSTIGRWSRRNTLLAYEELERRARAEGHEEALDEVRDLARVIGAGKLGRFSEQRLGPFVVGQIIGRGAMGEVYEAERPGGGGPVAIKVLHADAAADPQRLARFAREARAIAAIDSRHVVGVVDMGASPVPYLAMDRLHGTDLGALLRERRTLDGDDLVRLVEDAARGLDAARRAGIVHRDIKPSNLFRERDSARWKILDFGVSRLAGLGGTLTGDRVVGTPAYMAPEQVTGEPITHATDVYGLAAVVYRCLTGRPPYSGSNVNELLYKVVNTRPRRPSVIAPVPPAVDDVLAIALARHARDRYQGTLEFADALAAALRTRALT